jgi:predicted Zn-dependent peptidase
MTIKEDTQPILMLGWKIEDQMNADWPVYQAIADILGQGRTSRLYTKLVKEDKQAVQAFSFAGFPGSRYTNLMTVFGIPVKGVGAAQLETSIRAEVARLVAGGVTAEELAGVKQRARANFLRGLDSNNGLAQQLASYQMDTGDWRRLFSEVKRLEAVTADDVKRVAAEIFQDQRLTVAMIENAQS